MDNDFASSQPNLLTSASSAHIDSDRILAISNAAGAKAVLVHEPGRPLVATSLRIDAGSRDDPQGLSGLAHILEHMMLCGTRRFGWGGHLQIIQAMGGFVDAKTSADWTKSIHLVSPDVVEALFDLETERFANAAGIMSESSLDIERDVVLNERYQRIDGFAYGAAIETIVSQLYPVGSAYHKLPIGSVADIRRAGLGECLAFHSEKYVGPRVNLAVVGNLDLEATITQATDLLAVFGTGTPDAMRAEEITQQPTSRIVVHSEFRPKVYIGCLLPASTSWNFELARFAGLFLGRGISSRLPDALVRQDQLASAVAVKTMARAIGGSVGILELVPAEGVSPEQVVAALDRVMQRTLGGWLSESDLKRAKAVYRSSWHADDDTLMGRSDSLSLSMQLFGSISSYLEHDARIGDLQLDDLRDGLRLWHQPKHRLELIYSR